MKATISPNEIHVEFSSRPDVGRDFLTIDVENGWDDVKNLSKKVLIYGEGNQRFTFTGWNSDTNKCFFAAPLGRNASVATIL